MNTEQVPPRFSVVIPIHNSEKSIREAVDSVLEQSLARDQFEAILVNDGSTDSTAEICDDYATRFPDQIRIIHQDNQGVSSALNTGVRASRGQFIGFLGSDDWISADALEAVSRFFDEYGDECDLAAIPIYLFGKRSGPHWNNRTRFDQTRVIDVSKEWNFPQISGGGTFIRADLFRSYGISFDPRLFVAEDLVLNTEVILRRMKYGVVSGPRYFNRRYDKGSSLVSSAANRAEYYTDIPHRALQRLFDVAREMYGKVPLYVQAAVTYDLGWRVRGDISVLPSCAEETYRETLQKLLKQIKVKVIMYLRVPIEVRLTMLQLREGERFATRLTRKELTYYLEGHPVYSLELEPKARHRPARCDIEFFETRGDKVRVEGRFVSMEIGDWVYGIRVGSRDYPVTRYENPLATPTSYAQRFSSRQMFHVELDLLEGERLTPTITVTPKAHHPKLARLEPRMHRYTEACGNPSFPYYRRDGRTVYRKSGPTDIKRVDLSVLGTLRTEIALLVRAYRAGAPLTDLTLRGEILIRKLFKRKIIWLISDQKSGAGGTGEAMFRYLCSTKGNIEPRFILSKSASEYSALSRVGKVIEPNTRSHLISHFLADVRLHSTADDTMTDPFGAHRAYLNDLSKGLSVFVQHRATTEDQSSRLNRWAKGFGIFVTTAIRERDFILTGGYGYRPDQVVVTGIPHHDRLDNYLDRNSARRLQQVIEDKLGESLFPALPGAADAENTVTTASKSSVPLE